MHGSFFSLASALTISSVISVASAGVAGLFLPKAEDQFDKRLVCIGDSFNEVFVSVGMGAGSPGLEADIEGFCRYWIDIPSVTSFVTTITPTTFVVPLLSGVI
jgi:hypothetical protein